MDSISHHPDNELMTAYSAGNLPLSQSLCISAHMEHCNSCRQTLKRLNCLGSALMHRLDPSPVAADLKSAVLAQLDELPLDGEKTEVTSNKLSAVSSSVPQCLRQLINDDYQHLDWKRLSSDIHSVELCRDDNGAKVELLKIKPGGSAATHTHSGNEYTVILKGSFSDEQGLYVKGDFLMRSQHDSHTPVATRNSECICLAVTEGPVRLTGFFSRLFNPLLRYSHA